MASESPGRGIEYQGTVGSTNVVSNPFSVDQYSQVAVQIKTDGTAAVNYTIQATCIASQAADFGPPYRSDSAASPDWSTVMTGSTTTSPNGASTIATLNYCPYRSIRVLLNASSNVVTVVYAFGTGSAS